MHISLKSRFPQALSSFLPGERARAHFFRAGGSTRVLIARVRNLVSRATLAGRAAPLHWGKQRGYTRHRRKIWNVYFVCFIRVMFCNILYCTRRFWCVWYSEYFVDLPKKNRMFTRRTLQLIRKSSSDELSEWSKTSCFGALYLCASRNLLEETIRVVFSPDARVRPESDQKWQQPCRFSFCILPSLRRLLLKVTSCGRSRSVARWGIISMLFIADIFSWHCPINTELVWL